MSKSGLKKSEPEISSRPDSVPAIKDPELLKEWESLTDPDDRADFLEALAALEEVERDGTVSWEELKAELGF
jgi:hypothetical protein